MYGMNRPKKTITAIGAASGAPSRNMKTPTEIPSKAAMTAVPRR